jgi:hypothetical protein
MKHLKILGLAGVAAMAFMAFAAGTASATKLYSGGTALGTGTTIHITSTGTSILESGETILDECKHTTIHITIGNSGSAAGTVSGPVGSWTSSECTKPTKTIKNGELEIHHIAGTTNGTLTVKGTEVTVEAFEGVSCVYTGEDVGTLVGGSPATITANAVIKKTSGGFLCPSAPRSTVSYKLTTPNPLTVEAS